MLPTATPENATAAANDLSLDRFYAAQPHLVDIAAALDVVPGMRHDLVLTSGPTMPWSQYTGGQRNAILGSVVYEGLATDLAAAARALESGDVTVEGCQDHDCVGSLSGVTSASMPVVVVEDATDG